MKRHILLSTVFLLPALVMAAPKADKTASTLASGTYTANVKSIPCEGCISLIEETLKSNPALEKIQVNAEKKTLTFQVKKNVVAKMPDIQKELNAAAEQMGMGADFTLENIRAAKRG